MTIAIEPKYEERVMLPCYWNPNERRFERQIPGVGLACFQLKEKMKETVLFTKNGCGWEVGESDGKRRVWVYLSLIPALKLGRLRKWIDPMYLLHLTKAGSQGVIEETRYSAEAGGRTGVAMLLAADPGTLRWAEWLETCTKQYKSSGIIG